jgi:hypothetical protein
VPNGAPWTDDLAREPAVRRLVRALSLSQRFHFYIVTCKAPVVVDAVLDVVVRETAQARGGAPTIRRIDPYARHVDFTEPMRPLKLITDVMDELLREKSEGDSAISVLDATLASPDDDKAWERLFIRMNERRNAIVKALPREFVLFLPPRLDDAFKRAAPDFWSIRSGEYEVNALPPVDSAREKVSPNKLEVLLNVLENISEYEEACGVALEIGNRALRDREGGVALLAFRRMRDIAAVLLADDPKRSENIELAERGSLGTGRSLLLMGDVAGAEEAWRGARKEVLRARNAQEQKKHTSKSEPSARSVEPRSPHKVFISHAPEDDAYVWELERHLAVLQRSGIIRSWHTRRLNPGEDWVRAIDEHMQSADVVLLMLSPSFLNLEGAELEINRALEMAAESGTLVIPVLLRPADHRYIRNLAYLRASPKNGVPISMWKSRDEAWLAVSSDIREALASLPSRKR